jgi:hypothetical protein
MLLFIHDKQPPSLPKSSPPTPFRFAITTAEGVRTRFDKQATMDKVILFQPPKYQSKHEPAAVSVDILSLQDASAVTAWVEVRDGGEIARRFAFTVPS